MKLKELKRLSEAPGRGTVLAYKRTEVIFEAYENIEGLKSWLGEEEYLEIHLFDKDREYRAVLSEGHRFHGIKEHVADFRDSVYTAQAVREDGKGMLSAICHVAYDPDNGMAYIDDYRLSTDKEA